MNWIANQKMLLKVIERCSDGSVSLARDVGNGWSLQRFLVDDPCWCRADLACDVHAGGMVTETVWVVVDESGDVVELGGECSWPSFDLALAQYRKWKPDVEDSWGCE